jgi:Leucine-rich repeat (LRR) protein
MLTGLTKLRLSDNEIGVIPPEIASLENLRHLVLDRNKVAKRLLFRMFTVLGFVNVRLPSSRSSFNPPLKVLFY